MKRDTLIICIVVVLCSLGVIVFIRASDERAKKEKTAERRRFENEVNEKELADQRLREFKAKLDAERDYHEAVSKWLQHRLEIKKQKSELFRESGFDPMMKKRLAAEAPLPPPVPPPEVAQTTYEAEVYDAKERLADDPTLAKSVEDLLERDREEWIKEGHIKPQDVEKVRQQR